MKTHWLDRATASIAPLWTLKRQRARIAGDLLGRHYDAASIGRRTQGWRRSSADVNMVIGPALGRVRDAARELVRNNPYAESALGTIADHAVGWGLTAKPDPVSDPALAAWRAWAESTDCDADGRHDLYGLQKLVMRTVVESGEVFVRLRIRRLEDGFALPIQIQVLDPDFVDTLKEIPVLPNGGRIIQGVEFDPIGRRVAYWMFKEHPGSLQATLESVRVPADFVRHVFRPVRPGQVRGISWFAPVLLRFRDFDDLEDAQLMKQKIAACLAVIKTDPNGTALPLGSSPTAHPEWDMLEPGAVMSAAPGEDVKVVSPPRVDGYADYSKTVLRAIATGIGVTYEDLTGDYADMPFSAARMSRLRHWARVEDWRWRILIPQFCEPVWDWAMQAAVIVTKISKAPGVEWTGSPAPMIDPVNEGLAFQRNIRTGIQTLPDAIRERGYDPDALLKEYAASNKTLDTLGIILDSDPRKMTQAGQLQGSAAATASDGIPGNSPGAKA